MIKNSLPARDYLWQIERLEEVGDVLRKVAA
jgi:hypothetical protein